MPEGYKNNGFSVASQKETIHKAPGRLEHLAVAGKSFSGGFSDVYACNKIFVSFETLLQRALYSQYNDRFKFCTKQSSELKKKKKILVVYVRLSIR